MNSSVNWGGSPNPVPKTCTAHERARLGQHQWRVRGPGREAPSLNRLYSFLPEVWCQKLAWSRSGKVPEAPNLEGFDLNPKPHIECAVKL